MQRFNKIRQLVDQLEQEMVSLIEDRQELEGIRETKQNECRRCLMQNENKKPMTCEHCNEEMIDVRTIEMANQTITLWKCPYCDQQEVDE